MNQINKFKSAQYDAQDRLISYGNTEFQYNANGDLTAKIQRRNDINEDFDDHSFWGGIFYRLDKNDTRETQYTYDVFGNLKSVILPDGKNIDYIIDGQNRRVGKKVNGKLVHGYIYQNQTQIAAEIDGKGNITKQFIYGEKVNIPDYMIMNGKEYRIISNQVGTPELIVDVSSGKVVEELNFDEFGIPRNRLERSIIPFGFAGGIYDHDTGLVRFGARDYDPVTGRFMTKDPIGFNVSGTVPSSILGGSGNGPMQTNLYAYSLNDPINFVDPSGLWGVGIGISIGGYVGGGYDVSGGIYFGTNNGSFSGGFYGSASSGFGSGGGAGVCGTYYPGDTSSISGPSTNYNFGWGPGSVSIGTNPDTGGVTSVGGTWGWGTPKGGGSVTFGNTGTFGF